MRSARRARAAACWRSSRRAGGPANAARRSGGEKRGPAAAGLLPGYRAVDIALDTYPYNGTTTTCEALWMGVPVVTLAGPTHVSRVGASILGHLALDELVASTTEEYAARAASRAADAARRRALRQDLRARMQASALLDGTGFTRAVESAYRSAWHA